MTELYKLAVGGKWVSPAEFWGLTPVELWWLVDANRPEPDYGNMTAAEVAEIYAETYGAD